MKIFKSIKWRLQLWHGLILVVVLAGFGGTAYQLERGRLFGRIDNELHHRVGILANSLRRPPPRGLAGSEPAFDRPPPGQFLDDRPPAQNSRSPHEFHLRPEDVHFFDTNDPNHFYFVINLRDGNVLAHTIPVVQKLAVGDDVGNYQSINEHLPSGEWIEVGCSIVPELKELDSIALRFVSVGGIILLFGLVGGWWFVGRALRPISQISSTATKISAGDLSQRINVSEAESELGQLAAVLNSTFARLETAFAQQKQFAADAAHELRTPVSVILTQTQTALNRERDAASYKQTVEACQRAAQRMRKLIESLLALARFDAGQEVLKRLRFDFSQTISDAMELVQPLADEREIKIISQISSLKITGDSERLAQVVMNLLTNAIQYNQSGGEVRVKLEPQAGLAVLTVTNSGPGIAPADLPRVFERFYRADQSRTGTGNAGLGLSICKAIVEAHGGTIEAASEAGMGTTFTVRLPLGTCR
jgi:two-component system OmpR family sensor kinase